MLEAGQPGQIGAGGSIRAVAGLRNAAHVLTAAAYTNPVRAADA